MELSNASDDEYIDMEISSSLSLSLTDDQSSSLASCSLGSFLEQQSRDFEFPTGSTPQGRAETEFPADELFYKGKLLPLHLPPRLQMVRRLQSPKSRRFHCHREDEDELEDRETYSLPAVLIMPLTAPSTNTSTPLIGSCNISPSESCRVSCELNPEEDDCFFEWSTELRGFIHRDEKNRFLNDAKCSPSPSSVLWSKRLKQIRACLRSLFSKTKGGGGGGCSGGPWARTACNVVPESGRGGFGKLPKRASLEKREHQGHSCNGGKSLSSSVTKRIDRELAQNGAIGSHRKSFSAVIQRHCTANKPSSSSSSSSSTSSSSSSSSCSSLFLFKLNNGVPCEFQLLKRSSSASSELENSISGAIAHCKNSHELLTSQKSSATTTSEIASC